MLPLRCADTKDGRACIRFGELKSEYLRVGDEPGIWTLPETQFQERSLRIAVVVLGSLLLTLCRPILADENEMSLFSNKGTPAAYVAVDEGMTVYLWSGKPIAYLERDIGTTRFHVYGFNGKHLGWFDQGVIWDKHGDGSCAVKERLQTTQVEPFKALKQSRPLKAIKEIAPVRPDFSNQFGQVDCGLLLAKGEE